MPVYCSRSRILFLVLNCFACCVCVAQSLDLSNAVIVVPSAATAPELKSAHMLQEEVEKRTHVNWPITNNLPGSQVPTIEVGTAGLIRNLLTDRMPDLNANSTAEGFHLAVASLAGRPAVLVLGNDSRGVLFGVGRLLRELHMRPGSVTL